MTTEHDIWPPSYVDPTTGTVHGWDDPVPAEDDDDSGEPYTYREMVMDQAEANGMDVEEYLEHLAFRRGEWDDDDGEYDDDI